MHCYNAVLGWLERHGKAAYNSRSNIKPGVVVYTCNPSNSARLKQEDLDLRAGLGKMSGTLSEKELSMLVCL